uniref:Uncharacterized protein n=1 Tax=Odontella aurita TaxID=265563 RepID=A0A6U6KL18_9STRA|mmetsp:Transcript_61491/g.181718  ORF Transcript_61491/g.181718 Transcript_61491/m.181718 type:complete len:170 (+) Transcript_61491:772-1281(+)
MRGITFFIGDRRFPSRSDTPKIISFSNFVAPFFNNQNNAVRSESMVNGQSFNNVAGPVIIVGKRVLHVLAHGTATDAPLESTGDGAGFPWIQSTQITRASRATATIHGKRLGVNLLDISNHSMGSGGAMALLVDVVGEERIKMLRRWRSDVMMHHLHTTAHPVLQGFTE